jgi:small subunit ribosomal protein S10e
MAALTLQVASHNPVFVGQSFRVSFQKYDLTTMFIPKQNRIATFSYLFKEGVLVVKKDTRSPTHPAIEGPSNLEVLCLMKSLKSRGFVRITFNWQYNYCYLTTEGIEYLRNYLALPAEIVPATHKKTAARPGGRDQEDEKPERGGDRPPAFRGGERSGGFGRGGGM